MAECEQFSPCDETVARRGAQAEYLGRVDMRRYAMCLMQCAGCTWNHATKAEAARIFDLSYSADSYCG